MPPKSGRDLEAPEGTGRVAEATRAHPSTIECVLGLIRGRVATGFVAGFALSVLVSGCGGSSGSAGTPLVPTGSPSPVPSPTHGVPSLTPEPSSTPAAQGLVAEAQVADPFALAWSPRGDVIAVTTAKGLALVQAISLSEQRLISTEKPLEFLAFQPDGDLLATTEAGTRFQLWSMPSGYLELEQEYTINPTFGIAYDDGGELFLSFYAGRAALVISVWNDGKVTGGLAAPGGADWAVDFAIAPDGKSAAFNGFEGIEVWSFESTSLVKTLNGERAAAVRFNPDGSILAAVHWDGVARLWSIESGEVIQSFEWGEAQVRGTQAIGLDFSPDGRLLAVAGQEGRLLVWDLGAQRIAHTFPIPPRVFNSISFSPDGTRLASIGEDGLLQIWAVEP